ncbi:TPA: SWIM zinc finger domain-containing protein [Stenotrophomonas maltophilia]
MTIPIPYDDQDLFRWFDEVTLGRSEQCIGGVCNLQRHGDLLIADVQGSARHPYSVEIDLGASTRTPRSRLQGDCSCPVGHNCKHVAAALVV